MLLKVFLLPTYAKSQKKIFENSLDLSCRKKISRLKDYTVES